MAGARLIGVPGAKPHRVCGRRFTIQQVDADVAMAGCSLGGAARQADHRPVVLLEQPFDDVAPDDAERPDHDGLFVLGHAASALCPATMVEEFRSRWKSA